jgi:hypothetical protein
MAKMWRSAGGLIGAASATVLGVGVGLWSAVGVVEWLGDVFPGNGHDYGVWLVGWAFIGLFELALGGLGLFLGYRFYFRITR